jgi:hypothetical protein
MDNPVNSQDVLYFKGYTYVFSAFHYGASGDTVKVPLGCTSAAVLTRSGTAPTATVAQGDGTGASAFDTVTLTGGTLNNGGATLVSRHTGGSASTR